VSIERSDFYRLVVKIFRAFDLAWKYRTAAARGATAVFADSNSVFVSRADRSE
jgi:hypothetical protein